MNWLFLRGLVREQGHWGELPRIFEKTLGEKVHFLDLPGVGAAADRWTPWSVPEMTEDLRARFLPLREKHPGAWNLFSISLGGMVALDWAASYPEDFERLVVLNSSAANLNPPWERLRFRTFPKVLRAGWTRDPLAKETRILSMTTALLGPKLSEHALHGSKLAPVSKKVAIRQLIAAIRFQVRTPLAPPVLVLSSAADRFTDPSCSERLAQKLKAPLRVHPRAGHDVGLDDPQWVADRVAEWVGSSC